jgi:hypothetical protein
VDALRFLDLITAEPVSALGDAALEALRKLAAKAGRAAIYENAGFYPAKTSKRLVECEVRDVLHEDQGELAQLVSDLRKLQGLVSFNEELAALFAAVRKQRLGKPRCLSADPSVDLAAVLRDLAKNDVYKRDYIDVTTDLLYDDMPYEEAVKAIYELPGFVSGIDWSNCLDLSTADYSRIFAKNADDLEAMLAASEATPLEECVSMEDGIKDIAERINR